MALLPPDVRAALKRQVPKVVKQPLTKEVKKEFKRIKAEMIKEFLQLPVTQEILQGPYGSNISGTLSGATNLFAFIGFDRGEQPIIPILSRFEAVNIQYKKALKRKVIGAEYYVNLPTPDEIFALTPLPWAAGRSWAQGIERGISGLGFLLRKNNKGRSGAAIQTRVKVRGGKFKNVPYMSAFLNKYKKRFEQLK